MIVMDSNAWDARYAASDLVWSAGPNMFVEQLLADLPPGRALDLAAGEGRNALWLAGRGWQATAVDFSGVAMERAAELAAQRLGADAGRLTTIQADLLTWTPEPAGFDLVLAAYLHLVPEQRTPVMRRAADAVAPGGTLLVVGHDLRNIAEGHGGPQDPTVLCGPDDIVADIAPSGLVVDRAETVVRPVALDDGGVANALDMLVLAHRPGGSRGA